MQRMSSVPHELRGNTVGTISHLTRRVVTLAKNDIGGRGEFVAPTEDGSSVDYDVVSLYCLWVYRDKHVFWSNMAFTL